MNRRDFLKLGGLSALGALFAPRLLRARGAPEHKATYWIGGRYFIQDTVDTSDLPERIWARIDGHWHVYPVRQLPNDFVTWSIQKRIERLNKILAGEMPSHYDGPHSAAVATYSRFARGDSEFQVNNAVKGMGFIPKQERISEVTEHLRSTLGLSMYEKVQILIDNYSDRDLWDTSKHGSLELYTSRSFETHTFTNQMRNPISTVVFLDSTSYELRTVARLIHPNDPTLCEDERAIAEYINLVHAYFHGGPTDHIATVYYVIEVFDNSPGQSRPGSRVVPPLRNQRPARSIRSNEARPIGY